MPSDQNQTTGPWSRIVRLIGGAWTWGKLDVVIHDRGLMVLWAAKLRDKGRPRELMNWRLL